MYELLIKIKNIKNENEPRELINDFAKNFGKIGCYLRSLIKDKLLYGQKY